MVLKDKEKTAIQLSKKTRDGLKKLGSKGDTYDDIICNLISRSDPNLGLECDCKPIDEIQKIKDCLNG